MVTNPMIALDRAELAALRDHHLLEVHARRPDDPEYAVHLKRAEHLNDLLAEMPQT